MDFNTTAVNTLVMGVEIQTIEVNRTGAHHFPLNHLIGLAIIWAPRVLGGVPTSDFSRTFNVICNPGVVCSDCWKCGDFNSNSFLVLLLD